MSPQLGRAFANPVGRQSPSSLLSHSQHSNNMSLPTEKYGNLTVTPIMEGFGAEVSGVDFSSLPLPDELIKQVSIETPLRPGTSTEGFWF